jgi:hypothetical protein
MTRLVSLIPLFFLAACGGGDSGSDCLNDPAACHETVDAAVKKPCGDGTCDRMGGETATTCAADCHQVCGDLVCEGTETGENCPGDCNAKLKIENDSSYVFYYVYYWQCGHTNDGVNRLSGSLPYGYYLEDDTMTPGCWNIQANTSGNTKVLTMSNVTLKATELYTWTLNN